ncbi:MAG: 2-dehydropantoate 2-reductase [Halioglobus sp.]|nr:2-dehydropantoate 2-reductase [Halioglobus sp.]
MAEATWHVLGAGAIGCLFADYLVRGNCEVTLIERAGKTPGPILLESACAETATSANPGARGAAHAPLRALGARTGVPKDSGPITHLLITTKAYDVLTAMASIAPRLGNTVALLMVNGLGLAESLSQTYPQLSVFYGTTTEGAYRRNRRHVVHAGRGETRIGAAHAAEPPPWFGQWSRSVPRCLWDADIDTALWAKLAVNCVINPLTAVHGCRNGALAERPELAARVAQLCREVSQVSYAAGYTGTAQAIDAMVARVIQATAANRSSMLQDVQAGRPTEIEYITGYLLQVAAAHGVPAVHNRQIMQEVERLDP